MGVRLREHLVKDLIMMINWFGSDSMTKLLWIFSSDLNQQLVVANRVAVMLETTDISEKKQVSGIKSPLDVGRRAINIEELGGIEFLTEPPR